jgi:hypothetical protein
MYQFRNTFLLALTGWSTIAFSQEVPKDAPSGNGQLETPPALIAGGTDEDGRKYSYLGQPAKNGKLIFTASNGFFSKGACRAAGESDLPKVGDEELIVPNYGYLENWTNTEGTIQWYVHIANPGAVRFQTYLEVEGRSAGSEIAFQLGDQIQTVKTGAASAGKPQSWDVVFPVSKPGEYRLTLQAKRIADPGGGVGKLHRMEAFGPALEGAHLLRVRWRPAAVHGGYESSRASNSRLLVMTTRSVAPISSYSPVTTPFGYFGTSFTAEKRSNGEFNFSMWGNDKAATDLKQMPHLLGVGSPEGEFSGFGHEGSGVKARGWTPMPDGPELCVQALRVEPGELYDSYYGYYFDHPTGAWKFYCAGNKWHGGKSKEELKVGSFCEVPGPPQVERTGDVYREVRRRGWYFVNDSWVPMDVFKPGGAGSGGDEPVNKRWYTTQEGEFAMGCGGIRLYHAETPGPPGKQAELPYFLASESVSNLFRLPVEFGDIEVSGIGASSATVDVPIMRGEGLKDGAIYYGTVDALTFAPRELHGTEKNSSLSQAINESSWQEMVEMEQVQAGVNRVVLSDLEPSTTYFLRVLVNNEVSRIWNEETIQLTTPASGTSPAAAMTKSSRLTDEPVRVWTYSAGGQERQIEGRLVGISGGSIEIERKADGKKGKLDLKVFSAADQEYVAGRK